MKIFRGVLVHATEESPMLLLDDHLLGVKDGKIIFVEPSSNYEELKDRHGWVDSDVTNLNTGEFLIPGFVDSHIHAGQYSNLGKCLDMPLLEWLDKYTFPTEAAFKDQELARDIYEKAVRCVLRNGTTTACYFATIHTDSTLILCDVIEQFGQRAYVGKVNMDQNSPQNYIEETQKSIADTERFIQQVRQRKNPLVEPIVTPRFGLNTTEPLLVELGKLVKKYDVPCQTHIAETVPECERIREVFPAYKNYLDVYHKNGLVTSKTVLAHGIYLSDAELDVMRETGAGISHCPNSNLSIRSGLCDVRRLLSKGVKVGLGTDCSGGYSPSIVDSMRHAIQVSNTLAIQTPGYKAMDFRDVFRLATLGGAQVLGLDERIGNFVVGKEFDALHVSLSQPQSTIDIFPGDTLEDLIQKFIFLGDDRNLKSVFVAGKEVIIN